MNEEIYKREAISYYYKLISVLDKSDYKYRECVRKIEWLLRADKSRPVAAADDNIIDYCKHYLGAY